LAVFDGFCSPEICLGKLMATGGVGLSHPAYDGGVVTVARDADQPELRNAGFAFSRSGDPRLFGGLRGGRYWIHGRRIWAFK